MEEESILLHPVCVASEPPKRYFDSDILDSDYSIVCMSIRCHFFHFPSLFGVFLCSSVITAVDNNAAFVESNELFYCFMAEILFHSND